MSFQFQTQRMNHLLTINAFTHICASSTGTTVSLRHDFLNCMQIGFDAYGLFNFMYMAPQQYAPLIDSNTQ